MPQKSVWAYIDETGDRGQGPTTSPIFGMSAVLVDDVGAPKLRAAVTQLRGEFGVPANKPMSWKEHVKTHDRRRRAAEVLGAVDEMKICYVFAIKSELSPSSYVGDRDRFYNYVAYKLYKSTIWAARNWHGDTARLSTRFGHVRHHDHTVTESYIKRQASSDPKIPFHMEQGLRWVSAGRYLESQAADLFCGFLKSALWPGGNYGYTEPSYLISIWRKIRNSENCAIPLGIMSMPDNKLVTNLDWFPCKTCPKRTPDT